MSYFDDPYYERCYCRECGERISFEEYEDNDGLCDYCYDEYYDEYIKDFEKVFSDNYLEVKEE